MSGVRFPLLPSVFVALALAGCATPQKQAEKADIQTKEENTRSLERRRMLAVENGEVNSQRGAAIYLPDPNKAYDPERNTASAVRNYGTKGASTKNFDSDRQLRLDTYNARDFHDAKANSAAQKKYGTRDANTHDYLLPDKSPGNKTAATKDSSEANKTSPSRDSSDSRRPYLGPESKKLTQKADPKALANWRSSGETVVESNGAIEKVSNLKPLSIDDIRDLLNKSK